MSLESKSIYVSVRADTERFGGEHCRQGVRRRHAKRVVAVRRIRRPAAIVETHVIVSCSAAKRRRDDGSNRVRFIVFYVHRFKHFGHGRFADRRRTAVSVRCRFNARRQLRVTTGFRLAAHENRVKRNCIITVTKCDARLE